MSKKQARTQPKKSDFKLCLHCNKPMNWRKKWRNNWASVKYCSERCRRSKNLS